MSGENASPSLPTIAPIDIPRALKAMKVMEVLGVVDREHPARVRAVELTINLIGMHPVWLCHNYYCTIPRSQPNHSPDWSWAKDPKQREPLFGDPKEQLMVAPLGFSSDWTRINFAVRLTRDAVVKKIQPGPDELYLLEATLRFGTYLVPHNTLIGATIQRPLNLLGVLSLYDALSRDAEKYKAMLDIGCAILQPEEGQPCACIDGRGEGPLVNLECPRHGSKDFRRQRDSESESESGSTNPEDSPIGP